LTTPPRLPEGAPGRITGFQDRHSLHDAASGLSAHLTQSCDGSPESTSLTIALDIDAYKADVTPRDTDDLPHSFDALRELKNSLFFSSITEATAEIYE
jgi:uncharacterized protein (TIGR04255 family)